MHAITDADREAAGALREILADISGFWHRSGDDGPLCQALARHRIEAEKRLADSLAPFLAPPQPLEVEPAGEAPMRSAHPEIIPLPRFYGPAHRREHRRSQS